jgi:hypothetical protein
MLSWGPYFVMHSFPCESILTPILVVVDTDIDPD